MLMTAASGTRGADNANEGPKVVFDHQSSTSQIKELNLRNGETFTVVIDRTCLDAFTYSFTAFERGAEAQGGPEKNLKDLDQKKIPIVYDGRYGGYLIRVEPKPGASPSACKGGENLGAAAFIVTIRQQEWNVSFSGGFTISNLTNPVFAIRETKESTGTAPNVTTTSVKRVVEEPDKQDRRRLGAASFVHLTHDSWDFGHGVQPGLAFGLGIGEDNRTEYLLGLALKLGDKATINFGRVWGAINRLPDGLDSSQPVTSDNVLNNLGSKTVAKWFFALSYSFIGGAKDKLLKPFADQPATVATKGRDGTQGAATEPDSVDVSAAQRAALEAAAKDTNTYKDVGDLKDLAATICKVEVNAKGTKAGEKVTTAVKIHVKSDSLATFAGKGKAAATAINKAVKTELAVAAKDTVDFAPCPAQ
jgi:hypothetical protein